MKISIQVASRSADPKPNVASAPSSGETFKDVFSADIAARAQSKDQPAKDQPVKGNGQTQGGKKKDASAESTSTIPDKQLAAVVQAPLPNMVAARQWTLPQGAGEDTGAPLGGSISDLQALGQVGKNGNDALVSGGEMPQAATDADGMAGPTNGSVAALTNSSQLDSLAGLIAQQQTDAAKTQSEQDPGQTGKASGSEGVSAADKNTPPLVSDPSNPPTNTPPADPGNAFLQTMSLQQPGAATVLSPTDLSSGENQRTLLPSGEGSREDEITGGSALLRTGAGRQAGAFGRNKSLTADVHGDRGKGALGNAEALDPAAEMRVASKASDAFGSVPQDPAHSPQANPDGSVLQQSMQTPGPELLGERQQAAQAISGSDAANAHAPAASLAVGDTVPGINSAHLIQSIHNSEMRLGMQSPEFGNISINASLSHQSLSAQISIDHSDLGHALAGHLAAIEEKLGNQYGIQARVEIRDGGGASSQSDSGGQPKESAEPRSRGEPGPSRSNLFQGPGVMTSPLGLGSSLLDIRI